MSAVYEKLGAFYLGKRIAPGQDGPSEDLLLYDAKDLTTHALCVGMTGSGKTGLCVSLLEEAAIDGIPALIIDPKGDLGNLLLTFPDLTGSDFAPWVDPAEAARKGLTTELLASETAEFWRKGLAAWGQDGARIQRLRDAADFAIYTPGSNAGRPLRVLRSFSTPPPAILDDAEALREKISGTVTALLGLVGIAADPIQSREHILIANLLDRAWREGRTLDLADLIREVQAPPFDRIGVLDLDAIFPRKDRLELSMRLNNLLASPGFSVWMEGDPLDIAQLLHTPEGRPRVTILSIAHLSDAERMFVVTLVLNELIAWMRTQSGTSSLRALLYMDEIFGYFPPSSNPPSKTPMLTLLKQARAFGVGVVLSSQNPVDLDYKGLSNCGTWFLGRLQTERDKARVIDGLEGAAAANARAFDRAGTDALLSGLGKRVFLMNNVHDSEPTLFQSRWALSYLRGPLTRQQIQILMDGRKTQAPIPQAPPIPPSPDSASHIDSSPFGSDRPVLPEGVAERFLAWSGRVDSGSLVYRPALIATARLHYVRATHKVDTWVERTVFAPLGPETTDDPWAGMARIAPELDFDAEPRTAAFAGLPVAAERARSYRAWSKGLEQTLYRGELLTVYICKDVDAVSAVGESEAEFRTRLIHSAREARDLGVEKLREKYRAKLDSIQSRIVKAEEKIAREQDQLNQQKFQTAIAIGSTLLGAFLGKKRVSAGNVGRATTAFRGAGRVSRERGDLVRAEDSLETLRAQLGELEREFEVEVESHKERFDPTNLAVSSVGVPPRKADISIETLALVWAPWSLDAQGRLHPAYAVDILPSLPPTS